MASKPLVIVESPAKAKTIGQILGGEYKVMASVGHVVDLPSSGLCVDVDDDFKLTYEVTKKEVIRDLKDSLKSASELYLATDEDREGEAIAWHLKEQLKPKVPFHRMVFHEITKKAIAEAVKRPRDIDMGLVDAQETRRTLDRLYGYEVSPVLWRKVKTGLSAGRVQSPAIRLIVERERERMRFRSVSYWDLSASHATSPAFTSTLFSVGGRRVASGKDFDEGGKLETAGAAWIDEARARALVEGLSGKSFTVKTLEKRPYTSAPKPPFKTSTLQQEGGRKLGMSAQQVMRVAQNLYERGYITYMRTDSVTLSDTAVSAARAQVAQLFGEQYLAPSVRQYAQKVKSAQEAHEAIRPAGEAFRQPEELNGELSLGELRLYELIWRRTLACQMADAAGESMSAKFAVATEGGEAVEFSASGRIDHLSRLPQGVRRGGGRSRGFGRRSRERAPGAQRGRARSRVGAGGQGPQHQPASEVHRGVAGEEARGARYRPTIDLRVDHGHAPGAVRVEEGPGPHSQLGSLRRRGLDGEALRGVGRARLHRRAGGGPRPNRPRRAREGRLLEGVLLRRQEAPRAQAPRHREHRADRRGPGEFHLHRQGPIWGRHRRQARALRPLRAPG